MTLQAPLRPKAPADGGMPARRAIVRWAWRLLRREWRSQILVTLLLLVAVAVAGCGGCVLYNTPPPANPTLGTASDVWILDGSDPPATAADVTALRNVYGTVDVVGHTPAKAPGLAQPIDYREQPLHGTYTGQLLAVHRGRAPTGPNEAAITTGVAELFGLGLGGSVDFDGHPRTIVGIAENPSDLTDDFVLVATSVPPAQSVSVFTKGAERPDDLRLPTLTQRRGQGANTDRIVITTLVLAGATILLLLVAFVAAAGFAVLAHRRLRQLGMLAALGATAQQVRLVMTATGVLVGAVAAAAGTAVGLLLWPLAASSLEKATHHRVDRLNIPGYLVAAVTALAVVMSAAAAWWPARAVSRLPVTLALSGRPPTRRPAHRPAVLAALLLTAGLVCLAVGEKQHPWLTVLGTVATALAIPFAGPLAVRLLAAVGSRSPVAVRLALNDLARHQARSGAAVAAISLAVGVPVAIVVIATSVQATPSTGNLNDRQLLVRIVDPHDPTLVPIRNEAQVEDLAGQVDRMAAGFAQPTVLPLDMAYDPAAPLERGADNADQLRRTQELGAPQDGDSYATVAAYVATPELLRLVGADPAAIPASTDVVTSATLPLVVLPPGRDGDEIPPTTRVTGPRYSSLPNTLLTADAITRRHLVPVRAGWLVESAQPLTSTQLADARRIAAAAGLTVEARNGQQGIQTARTGATAGGLLLALAVLAMTVGLIRSEAASDLRTLTAIGAHARIRRTLTATTAAGLALLGVVLGTLGTGLGLAAAYRNDLAVFGRVPPVYPLVFLAGIPVAAAAAGWLLSGKEPPAISRRMSE